MSGNILYWETKEQESCGGRSFAIASNTFVSVVLIFVVLIKVPTIFEIRTSKVDSKPKLKERLCEEDELEIQIDSLDLESPRLSFVKFCQNTVYGTGQPFVRRRRCTHIACFVWPPTKIEN